VKHQANVIGPDQADVSATAAISVAEGWHQATQASRLEQACAADFRKLRKRWNNPETASPGEKRKLLNHLTRLISKGKR
jgi:hypothetical protein